MTPVTLEMLLSSEGLFSWAWNHKFFIETRFGNYIWSCPDYVGGDNTIRRYHGGLQKFLNDERIEFVREKGSHVLNKYIKNSADVVAVGDL